MGFRFGRRPRARLPGAAQRASICLCANHRIGAGGPALRRWRLGLARLELVVFDWLLFSATRIKQYNIDCELRSSSSQVTGAEVPFAAYTIISGIIMMMIARIRMQTSEKEVAHLVEQARGRQRH